MRAFQLSLVISVALFAWLLWGLLTGKQADTASMPMAQQKQIIDLVSTLSFWLNVSLLVTVASSIIVYYDSETLAYALVGVAAVLAYGFQFCFDKIISDSAHLLAGRAPNITLGEMKTMALIAGIPGMALVVYQILTRIAHKMSGEDLINVTYGKDVKAQKQSSDPKDAVPKAVLGAFAKCWQLPFCREGIRRQCPIFHARTKCWKERVGCMCEENIIMLAMSGDEKPQPNVGLTKESGFVPIGDLITRSQTDTRAQIPTRAGPKGVRIPTNPHLTDLQKRERCRNCVIYNEHQRQKYQLLSAPATLLVPLIVFLEFDNLKEMIRNAVQAIDKIVAHLTFNAAGGGSAVSGQIAGSVPVETILIVCLALVAMTWMLRFLEYCTFKIKI